MSKRKIIIDTDPGIDDAAAIAIALFDETLDVKLLTTVAGNVKIENTTKNTLKLVEFFGKDIPVAQGAVRPLMKPLDDASDIHGDSGLAGYDFPEPRIKPLEKHGVVAMRDVIMESDTPVTLVPIGPLTNIALLFSMYPEVKNNIDEIVLMGGSIARGNKTPMAEFNFYVDPEAAKIVFSSSVPIVLCGLDMCRKALIMPEDSERIKNANKTGEMLYSLFKSYRGGSFDKGLTMYDSSAVAYLLCPEMYTFKDCYVDIETISPLTAGCSVVDLNGCFNKEPNTKVCTDINPEMFREWFVKSLSKCN